MPAPHVGETVARIAASRSPEGSTAVFAVRAASTANAADLAAVSTTMDGVTLVEGDLILLKDQSTASQKGIYKVGPVSGGAAPVYRSAGFGYGGYSPQPAGGCLISVSEGTAGGNKVFQLTTNDPIVVGTTSLTFGTAVAASVDAASSVTAGTMSIADKVKLDNSATARQVRGVVDSNMASLAAFVVSQDGITYVAGDRVLLVKQTTVAENGIYVVGTVAGTAPLTRPSDWAAGDAIVPGCTVEVGPDGTLYASTCWKATCAKSKVVDTHDPAFFPKVMKGVVTLITGVKALGATQGLWLYSTTKSTIHLTRDTPNTSTATTGGYDAPVADRTAGIIGTAAATIRARVAAGTDNTADISTINWTVVNF